METRPSVTPAPANFVLDGPAPVNRTSIVFRCPISGRSQMCQKSRSRSSTECDSDVNGNGLWDHGKTVQPQLLASHCGRPRIAHAIDEPCIPANQVAAIA